MKLKVQCPFSFLMNAEYYHRFDLKYLQHTNILLVLCYVSPTSLKTFYAKRIFKIRNITLKLFVSFLAPTSLFRDFLWISQTENLITDLKKVHSGLTESSAPPWGHPVFPVSPVSLGWWPLVRLVRLRARSSHRRHLTLETRERRERSQWQSRLRSLVTRKQKSDQKSDVQPAEVCLKDFKFQWDTGEYL